MNKCGYAVGLRAWRDFFQWQASLKDGRTPVADASPWMTLAAIRWLDSVLIPEMRIFEYGTGGSTLFFARRVREVVSVEHDPRWFHYISSVMKEKKYSNWQGHLIEPEREMGSKDADPSDPLGYVSSAECFHGFSFERYVKSIAEYGAKYFDLVVVDGRARPSCIDASMKATKKWILVDNTEREYYLRNFNFSSTARIIHFPGPAPYIDGFIRTSVIDVGWSP
jgi:hypothetical protein